MEKSLIEKWLPIQELSRDAAIEMAYKAKPAYIKHCRELKIPERKINRNFYDPKIRNLHPWFARRPCSVARAITLAAILPAECDKESFMKALGWNKKAKSFISEGYPPLLFYTDPEQKLINEMLSELGEKADEIIVCDPMAGGGTIPLEGERLGFTSMSVEYNPVAYLILKGTVEYPCIYGEKLAQEVIEESKKLILFAEETLGKFYPNDSEGYILARGFSCPNCNGRIPLLHNAQITRSTYIKLNFDASRKTFAASITKFHQNLPYEGDKRGKIICPYCGIIISKKEAYKLWTKNHVEILRELSEGIFDRDKILSTHVLLIKQTKQGYSICDENDISSFLEACKTLTVSFKDFEEFIPKSPIPQNNEVFAPIREYGIKYWYELFNPRQLLTTSLLIKYVYERCKELLLKGEFGAATSLYLAFGISRVIDYNSIATTWKRGTIRDTIGRYAQGRKITYGEDYCEAIIPYRNLNWIYEPDFMQKKKTEGGICPVLSELCKRTTYANKKVAIVHGDCRLLSSILLNASVDVINVDPPYFDQHIYSDISEYFWQVFRITLKPLIKAGFLFKESKLRNWKPDFPTVPREGEIIARKVKKKSLEYTKSFDEEWYTNQMGEFFKECFKVLKRDGILLTWFTHRSLEAWESIISALYSGGFYVTKIWPVTSELLSRLVSRENNSTLNKTLIIVARKREEKKISEEELKEYALHLMEEMGRVLAEIGTTRSELHTFLQAAAMCAATKVPLPEHISNPIQFCRSELIPKLVKLAKNMFPIIYEQVNKKHSKRTLKNFIK